MRRPLRPTFLYQGPVGVLPAQPAMHMVGALHCWLVLALLAGGGGALTVDTNRSYVVCVTPPSHAAAPALVLRLTPGNFRYLSPLGPGEDWRDEAVIYYADALCTGPPDESCFTDEPQCLPCPCQLARRTLAGNYEPLAALWTATMPVLSPPLPPSLPASGGRAEPERGAVAVAWSFDVSAGLAGFDQGQALTSPELPGGGAGVPELRLRLYPAGSSTAPEGSLTACVVVPPGWLLRVTLSVDGHTFPEASIAGDAEGDEQCEHQPHGAGPWGQAIAVRAQVPCGPPIPPPGHPIHLHQP